MIDTLDYMESRGMTVTMTEDEARRVTSRIRLLAGTVAENIAKLKTLIDEAKQGGAHVALGYPSWQAYISDALSDEPLRLETQIRRELVQYLAGQGMSTRAIAPIVGADQSTVVRDRSRGDASASPVEPEVIADERTGEVIEITEAVKTRVTPGLDGKTYTTKVQPKPRRRPITDTARDAGWELRKAVERIERIREDDRFTPNKDEVATHLRSHLTYAIEVCQDLLDGIN